MKQNKPVHSYYKALNFNQKKYGKELPIPRLIKDTLDMKNTRSKPNRYENYHVHEGMFDYDTLMDEFEAEEYRDELTDAYDLLKQMCGYNYDLYLEGEHISRIQQEYGLD